LHPGCPSRVDANETRIAQESAMSVKREAFPVDTSNRKINFIETVCLIHANILC
jgi:hypothetical protein